MMCWKKIDNLVCVAIVAIAARYFGAHVLVGLLRIG